MPILKKAPVICMMLIFAISSAAVEKDPPVPEPTAHLREKFLNWKFGMFIHFNIATFANSEWATGREDPTIFAPDKLDCDQWMDAAALAGMQYAVLTVKHTCGWCLWDSKHTESHDMTAFVNYQGGKGDIVREFVDACRKRNIKVGLYYCFPGDYAERSLPEGEEDKLHGLPPEAQGDYTGFIKKQLTELLSNYGDIDLLWVDQYKNKYTFNDWQEIKQHVKSLQPECLVIANNSIDFKETDIHSYEYPWLRVSQPERMLPPENNVHPAEVCDKMESSWFWKRGNKLKPARDVVSMLELCNSRRANYLLNVAPDTSGLIPENSVQRLREIGRLIKTVKSGSVALGKPAKASNVFSHKYAPAMAFDDNSETRWATVRGITSAWLEVDLGSAMTINRAIIDEGWDRVRKYELQYKVDNQWKTAFAGTTLGLNKQIDFPPVISRYFRLNILEAVEGPTIWEIQLFESK